MKTFPFFAEVPVRTLLAIPIIIIVLLAYLLCKALYHKLQQDNDKDESIDQKEGTLFEPPE